MRKQNNRPNPDNREDNVDHIQKNINFTIKNMEAAEELIDETSDEKMKKTLSDKNVRRRQALDGMRSEIRDEANAKKED